MSTHPHSPDTFHTQEINLRCANEWLRGRIEWLEAEAGDLRARLDYQLRRAEARRLRDAEIAISS